MIVCSIGDLKYGLRFEDGKVVNPGASGAAPVPLPEGDGQKDPIGDEDGEGGGDDGRGDQSPPTAAWIAGKIKAMIDSLPPLSSSGSSGSSPPTTDTPPADGSDSTDPHTPSPMDSKLLKFLSSAAIMNGSISKGRQSVWSALERLQGPSPPSDVERDGGQHEDDDDDDQSIMMYAPLVPTAKSKVEIAHSHTAFVPVEEVSQPVEEFSKNEMEILKWPWPFGGWGGKQKEGSPVSGGGGSKVPPDGTSSDGNRKAPVGKPKKPKVRKVTVWEPSTTNLSFQAMWWGYRL